MVRKYIDTFAIECADTRVEGLRPPCTLFGALMRAGKIENIDYAMNARALKSIARLPFSVYATLVANEALLSHRHVVLRIFDIDAPCVLHIGTESFSLSDAHRTYTLDVTHLLHMGENALVFSFSAEQGERNCSRLNEDFCDKGIFRRIEVIAYDECFIDSIKCRQEHENGKVTLHISAKMCGNSEGTEIVASVVSPSGRTYYCGLHGGKGSLLIADPILWWPHTLGTPSLYRLTLTAYRMGEIMESKTTAIGLRQLDLSLSDGMGEKEFALSVGAERFFVMGAELCPDVCLPMDAWLSHYEAFVKCCVMSNINLLFVTERHRHLPEQFYDLCDKHGILIMQDILPPGNAADSEEATKEYLSLLEQSLSRICTHPSLALLRSHLTGEDSIREIPSLLADSVPDAVYTNMFLSKGQSVRIADTSSAFPLLEGVASFPSVRSLARFVPTSAMNPYSETVETRACVGVSEILSSAGERYPYAMSMEQLVYLTQLNQAMRTREAIRHLRLKRPGAMGVILAAASDPYGRISPSVIDRYGDPKAIAYALRDAYAPDALILRRDGYRVYFYLSNEKRDALNLTLHYRLLDATNKVLKEESIAVNAPKDSLVAIHSVDFSALAHKREHELYVHASLMDGDTELHSESILFVEPKRFAYVDAKIESSIVAGEGGYTLILTPSAFAQSVYLYFRDTEATFRENFIDLTKNMPIRIRFTTKKKDIPIDSLMSELRMISVYDIGK